MILLAPMEGLLDCLLREVLTSVGGVDRCVSEFIRITDQLMPKRVFTRIVPELLNGGRTRAGVPVHPQLLGSDVQCMAENAARLAELQPEGIDLNFGCPAKCVNRHRGGAVLLDEPELIHAIVAAVRRAVPASVMVSAKMRLGYMDDSRTLDCARAIHAAGASEIVVHARTKADGYKPPAYWERIAAVREAVPLPIIANGEIWTTEHAALARERSGCEHLMLGRGMVANPALARQLAGGATLPWAEVLPLLTSYLDLVRRHVATKHQAGRIKQWLHYLRRHYPEAEALYDDVRTLTSVEALAAYLQPP
ncbi:tRNA dihydrouridine synthase [Roseateles paludis]|jgi:tRNA-dihydrouridine synthase C|uniref:tRNA-dihydrouridine(16) synthase n=1 Tax=Roseateles paludis TaxID=3145238 RepID=A0ABV0G0F2_9BURK